MFGGGAAARWNTEFAPTSSWGNILLGNGGLITKVAIADDGTLVFGTDTYGGYVWDAGLNKARQTLTTTGMPSAAIPDGLSWFGTEEIVIAPSNSNVVWKQFNGGIFKSVDKGKTFVAITFPGTLVAFANTSPQKNWGPYAAIDPFNENIVYWGTPDDGIFVTYNAGTSWTELTALGKGKPLNINNTPGSPASGDGGNHRIVFDRSGGTTTVSGQTRCANVFVHTYNVNTYRSTDGGQNYTAVSSTNKPAAIRQMDVDPFGVLWVCSDDYPFSSDITNACKYDPSTSTWTTNIHTGSGIFTVWYDLVAVDHVSSASKSTVHVTFLTSSAGIISHSVNAGGAYNHVIEGWVFSKTGIDVDYIFDYQTAALSNGSSFLAFNEAVYDRSNPGRMYIGSEGLIYCNPSSSGSSITFTQQSRGIEEYITNRIVSTPTKSRSVLAGLWDFPMLWTNNFGAYPTAIRSPLGSGQRGLTRGYSIDYAFDNPDNMVALIQDGFGGSDTSLDQSGYSTDGGLTWTKFTTRGSDQGNGAIVTAGSGIHLWIPASSANIPKITLDNGVTWNAISIPGGTPSAGWGPLATYTTINRPADSDKANGDLYVYNVNTDPGGSGLDAMYKRSKATGLWSVQKVDNGFAGASYINEVMKSSGVAGNLFFTGGWDDFPHPANKPFYYTTDGWLTKNTVTGFKEVVAFGFGAAAPGHSFPVIYVVGWYNNVYGIWMCKDWDTSKTWKQIGTYPMNIAALPMDIDGDKVVFGLVYVITNGGAFWGQFS